MPLEFAGTSLSISPAGLNAIAADLAVPVPEIWTVFAVETSGCGFLPDRRPPILFERHIFSHLTHGKYDDGDISAPVAGGYGPGGAAQYGRLARALVLDRNAALQSASWGLGQILGLHYRSLGFTAVEDMVEAACGAEDAQLLAFAAFLKSANLASALRSHDWAALAHGYNGPNYKANDYDTRLAAQYEKFSAGPQPDLNLRTAQLYLMFRGLPSGPVDGMAGLHTENALRQFQKQARLPVTGQADQATLAALQPGPVA